MRLSRRRMMRGWAARLLRFQVANLCQAGLLRLRVSMVLLLARRLLASLPMALLRQRVRSLTCTRASATRYPTPWMLPLILRSQTIPRTPAILEIPRTLMIRRSPRSPMLPRTLAGQRVRANRREQALCLREPAIAYPFFRWPSPPLPRWWLRYWRDLAAVNGCSAPCRIHCAWSRQCCSLGSALRRPCRGQGRPPCPRSGERTSVLRMNRDRKDVRPGCRRDLGVMVYGCGERTSVSPVHLSVTDIHRLLHNGCKQRESPRTFGVRGLSQSKGLWGSCRYSAVSSSCFSPASTILSMMTSSLPSTS